MGKIDHLSDDQIATLAKVRDEYIAHGLSTEPADRRRAEAAFARVYEHLNLPRPRIVWVDSPMAAHLAHAQFPSAPHGKKVSDQVQHRVGDQVRSQVGNLVWGQIADRVWGQIADDVWKQVWSLVEDHVRDEVGASKLEWRPVGLLCQQIAAWVGWATVAIEIGVQLRSDTAETFGIFRDLCQSTGCAYMFADTVIACERPAEIHRDERGRLHNESGAAVLFRDGWGVHAIHGVRVSREYRNALARCAESLALAYSYTPTYQRAEIRAALNAAHALLGLPPF